MPVRTAPYNTGSTIRKLMSTDSEDPRTHTSAKMMKLATGVALTSCSTGAIKISAAGQISAATASAALHTTPSPKPSRMRPVLNPIRLRQQPQQAAQGLHRRHQKDLLSDGHGRSLPHCQPEQHRPGAPEQRFVVVHGFPLISLQFSASQYTTLRPKGQ